MRLPQINTNKKARSFEQAFLLNENLIIQQQLQN
jgi:hypothetical protein